MAESEPRPSGMPTNRVEALSDGVFAIAMTVLVLGIQVPDGGGADALSARLLSLWPKFASYALSFVMLGVLWIGHHFQFQYIRRTDRALLWWNLIFLLAVTFLPFATGVLGNYPRTRLAAVLYGSTVFVAGVCLLAHWTHATKKRELVTPDLDDTVIASMRLRITAGLAITGVGTALGLIDTRPSVALFVVLPFVYLVRSRIDTHVARRK